jgi:hypothetical protein
MATVLGLVVLERLYRNVLFGLQIYLAMLQQVGGNEPIIQNCVAFGRKYYYPIFALH